MSSRCVVCFGDSNTWGYAASRGGARLDRWERWPGVLQRRLGDDWYVVEEGLNSRTTAFELEDEADRNGLRWLPVVLESHAPIDWLVLALGANDLFVRPPLTAEESAEGAGKLVDLARSTAFGTAGSAPRVLVLAPPRFGSLTPEWKADSPHGEQESQRFGRAFRAMAAARDVPLLGLDELVTASTLDGVHLEPPGHAAIAAAVASFLQSTDRIPAARPIGGEVDEPS